MSYAIRNDGLGWRAVNSSDDVDAATEHFSENRPAEIAVTPEQIIAQYTTGVQQHLDTFARTRNYDNILSAATYATSAVPKFQAEGQYAVEARDATWAMCYGILADVQGGQRTMPSQAELIAELPALVWPK